MPKNLHHDTTPHPTTTHLLPSSALRPIPCPHQAKPIRPSTPVPCRSRLVLFVSMCVGLILLAYLPTSFSTGIQRVSHSLVSRVSATTPPPSLPTCPTPPPKSDAKFPVGSRPSPSPVSTPARPALHPLPLNPPHPCQHTSSCLSLAASFLCETSPDAFSPCRVIQHFQHFGCADRAVRTAAIIPLPRLRLKRARWPTQRRSKLPVGLATRR